MEVGFELWVGIEGGLENLEACERRELVLGRISAGGAREAFGIGGETAFWRLEGPVVGCSRQKDSYVLEADSVLEKRSKSAPSGLGAELFDCLCMAIMVARGDAVTLSLPCSVDVDEAGDPVRDARDSTSSIVFDCQPLLTLTIAYDRRVRSSDDSWEDVSNAHIQDEEIECCTSPILLVADDTLLTALVVLEWPRLRGPLGLGGEGGFTCPSAVLFWPAVDGTVRTVRGAWFSRT